MENSFGNCETDSLLLLKERIIKTETLLEKYACLTIKFNDLVKSHSQAIENEKKAKKDAIKYLEKYCKLAKKSNSLLIKIKTLEDSINIKSNELKESQDEYTKLESVLQVYKTERKGHQCLKKDRDFLLTALWKVLKRLEEEPKEYKAKKITETFFKRFERELMELKLEDFRCINVKNISKVAEKEESEFLFSPGSQVLGSVESDFIDTDVAPESVKSSFEECDENYVVEGIKPMCSNHNMIDTGHHNDLKNVQENVMEPLLLPDLSFEPFASQDFEERNNSNIQEKHFSTDITDLNASENNDFNLTCNKEEESSLTSITSFNIPTQESSTDAIIHQHQGDEGFKSYHSFLQESRDKLKEEIKIPELFKKTYYSQKFKGSSQSDEIMNELLFYKCRLTDTLGANAISDATGNIKTADIDIFNTSNETISLDIDVSNEDIGSIPDEIQYCEKIYDFLTSGDATHPKERNFHDENSYLLYLTENELFNDLSEINFDTKKTITQKQSKTVSVFDVEDCGSSASSGYVPAEEELANTCLEFKFDSGNSINLREVVNKVFEVNEDDGIVERDEICIKPGNENQINKKCQNIFNSSLKESIMNCNSNKCFRSAVKKNVTEQETSVSDEEVFRVLRNYKYIRLLSPLKDKEPNERRKSFAVQGTKRDTCNVSRNIKVVRNLKKNMEFCEDMLYKKPNNREEQAIICNPKLEKEREKNMVDKFTQTDGKICLEVHETKQQINGKSKKSAFAEPLMRKICKIVWKKSLKKFKYLNNFGKMYDVHSTCFNFMKMLLEMNNRTRLYIKNRTKENSNFMDRKMGQSNSNLKCDKRKLFPWHVEDVDVANVFSKNEPLFNCAKVEGCSFFTEVPAPYYSKDRLNSLELISEETRTQKSKMPLNWFTSDQQTRFAASKGRKLEIYGSTCECNVCWKRGVDSDTTLLNCNSNNNVNDFEKRCESSAETQDTSNNVENTQKLNLKNIPDIDVIGDSWDAVKSKSDCLERCVEGKETKFQSRESNTKTTTESALFLKSPRISSQNTSVMEEYRSTNVHGLNLKESNNLMEVDFSEVSLPLTNDGFTEIHGTPSNKSINDILPVKDACEESKSSTLKEKFEELFGNFELQSGCSSPKSSKNLKVTPTPVEQKQVSADFEINANRYISEAAGVTKKRRVSYDNKKEGSADNKRMKLNLPSVSSNKDSVERFRENEVQFSDTFSSHDIKTGDSSNILDSIMTAMTKQTEFFKVKTIVKETEIKDFSYRNVPSAPQPTQPKECVSPASVHRNISTEYRMKGDDTAFLNLPYYWNADSNSGNQTLKEKKGSNYSGKNSSEGANLNSLVQKEIRKFLMLDINTVEEGEEKIKSCLSSLRKASENIIANVIVNEIMANVDEELKEFERPAPPLTQTQHRIMIILTVFSVSDEQFHRISSKILNIIDSKIFPENFFWPDDSLEMATRFYAALCKRLNNFKGIWKFCFKAITSMRQRWCIPILVVLQVWPDIIHNANKVQNNLLVKTFVNIILHTPKSEHMRRKRQEQKLLAIKHLLINFYNFDLNSTIESFTQNLWESLAGNTPGSFDALVLVCKCRNWSWTRKNIIPKLLETLESWMNGKVPDDIMVSKVLDILQQITIIFPDANDTEASSAKDVISVLTQILANEKLNPILEEKVIRTLCSLSHYSDVKDTLVRVFEKFSTSEPISADIRKALSSTNRKSKQGCRKANKKTAPIQKARAKARKKDKKKKRGSSRQESVLDVEKLNNVQA